MSHLWCHPGGVVLILVTSGQAEYVALDLPQSEPEVGVHHELYPLCLHPVYRHPDVPLLDLGQVLLHGLHLVQHTLHDLDLGLQQLGGVLLVEPGVLQLLQHLGRGELLLVLLLCRLRGLKYVRVHVLCVFYLCNHESYLV